jgi:iron complex transport system substrate-binding protein
MTQAEIDAEVTRRLHAGEPIYEVDPQALARAAPDLVLTQELCAVCAATPGDLAAALETLPQQPEVLQLTPRSLADILQNVVDIGRAVGRSEAAARLVSSLAARIAAVTARAPLADRRPRVFCMEWLDPPYCSGHWVPEMVELCGGVDELSRKGSDSVRVPWEAVLAWAPEVLIVMPCGFDLDRVVHQAELLPQLPGWRDLPAVQAGRVHAVDADAYFARPGPRVVDGLELLAHLVHPELFDWSGEAGAVAPLRTKTCPRCEAAFLCRPEPGCWCEGVALPAGAADALSACWADCLCPKCLGAEAAAGKGSSGREGGAGRTPAPS